VEPTTGPAVIPHFNLFARQDRRRQRRRAAASAEAIKGISTPSTSSTPTASLRRGPACSREEVKAGALAVVDSSRSTSWWCTWCSPPSTRLHRTLIILMTSPHRDARGSGVSWRLRGEGAFNIYAQVGLVWIGLPLRTGS